MTLQENLLIENIDNWKHSQTSSQGHCVNPLPCIKKCWALHLMLVFEVGFNKLLLHRWGGFDMVSHGNLSLVVGYVDLARWRDTCFHMSNIQMVLICHYAHYWEQMLGTVMPTSKIWTHIEPVRIVPGLTLSIALWLWPPCSVLRMQHIIFFTV